MNEINPWASNSIEDYAKLFEEFGIRPFKDLLPRIEHPHRYMRRGIIFGHRSYDEIVEAMANNKPFSAMSGFMPSGPVHLGHKMVMEELIWHQQQGASVFMGIADREAHAVRGMSWEQCRELGVKEYILSAIALGFKPEKGYFYFQSKNEDVKELAFELGCKANFSELSAIYGFSGETNISHMLSAVTQSADILHPQLIKYGGPRPVVIPVGADQDPHIRLTRGLSNKMRMFTLEGREDAQGNRYVSVRGKAAPFEALKQIESMLKARLRVETRLFEAHVDILTEDMKTVIDVVREVELANKGYAFVPPASTYHKFMSGLQGGKMSSSIPDSVINLSAPPENEAKKVKKAKTGGCVSLEEQKKYGGKPEQCTVYELLMFHLIENDPELEEIYVECTGGRRMCGPCKQYAAELMEQFLREHQEKREQAAEQLSEYNIKV
jgi:tryptophanyl-tRNA synthetase